MWIDKKEFLREDVFAAQLIRQKDIDIESLQTSNSALSPRNIGLQLTIHATIPLIYPAVPKYVQVHELQYSIGH